MSRGMTIAEFVQQVLYRIYGVRLDTMDSEEGSFHSKSDRFKEVVMEANLTLQEFQKEQDWNFLRERWEMGLTMNPREGGIQEFAMPEWAYKVCTGYNDAVRLHIGGGVQQIPWDEARSGNHRVIDMYDETGRINADKDMQRAFFVGNDITFYRPWRHWEELRPLETDVIRYIEPFHICGEWCDDHCPKAYDEKVLTWLPDPMYIVTRTAAKRAAYDPSAADIIQVLTDDATKMLSSMRENDSSHTMSDTYDVAPLGFVQVL